MPYAYKSENWEPNRRKEDKIVICIGLALAAIGLALIVISFIRWYFTGNG